MSGFSTTYNLHDDDDDDDDDVTFLPSLPSSLVFSSPPPLPPYPPTPYPLTPLPPYVPAYVIK